MKQWNKKSECSHDDVDNTPWGSWCKLCDASRLEMNTGEYEEED